MFWAIFKEDVKSKGITYFKKDIKYAIQFESKKHIFISTEPDKRNCNQVCRFSKKEQKYIFDIVED